MMQPTWTKAKRPVKRSLSAYEKENLPNTEGRALILPGEPGTEVEELVRAGFDPSKITCVEHDPDIALFLREFYGDYVNLFEGDVFDLSARNLSRGEYSYIHLDLCSQTVTDTLYDASTMIDLLSPRSRFRFTYTYARKLTHKTDEEIENIVYPFIDFVRWLDEEDTTGVFNFAVHSAELEQNMEDYALPASIALLCKAYFDVDRPINLVEKAEQGIPVTALPYAIGNKSRYTYTEIDSKNHMISIWFDRQPITPHPDSGWMLLHRADELLTQLTYLTPPWEG